jgi:AICAR transformylase/IMP cyclohydrolase PurH
MAKTHTSKVCFMAIWMPCSPKLNGKELSYNNLVDVDAAVALIDEFEDLLLPS